MSLVGIGRKFSYLLQRSVILGRLAFRFSGLCKRVGSLFGYYDQRAVEYPWVLYQLKRFVPKGSRVLDVGCAESALCHELVARGYEVWCVDINLPLFCPKSIKFVKADIRQTNLPSNFFDAIIIVSVIEHVGLPVYGQEIIEEDGDIKAMEEVWRICKPGGYVILTTPFSGKEFILHPTERRYNMQRLKLLTKNFKHIVVQFYMPKRRGKKLEWVEIPPEEAKYIRLEEPGIACLVLSKP